MMNRIVKIKKYHDTMQDMMKHGIPYNTLGMKNQMMIQW